MSNSTIWTDVIFSLEAFKEKIRINKMDSKSKNKIFDILLVMFLAVLLWFVITAWDAVIDKFLFDLIGAKPDNLWGLFTVASIHTIVFLAIFLWLDVDLVETFGIHFNEKSVCKTCAQTEKQSCKN